ncbi:MAG: putative molybdenum carrier protein [Pirellulaceae bacterium]
MHLPSGAPRLTRIVSGGQTGVDQAALATAIALEIPHGGWCPLGRRSESGTIPVQYQLEEMPTRNYAARTRQNVIDSDGTLIVYRDQLSGGTLLTQQCANQIGRPLFLLDVAKPPGPLLPRTWLDRHCIAVLNVAGPRESTTPGIFAATMRTLQAIFASHQA